MKCSICGGEIESRNGWDQGHNAEPVNAGRCCDSCNASAVIPARLLAIGSRFQLGRMVATAEVHARMGGDAEFAAGVSRAVSRHSRGDWGNVSPSDAAANTAAIGDGSRILSAYTIGDRDIWVITEADRSVTTVLFPDEY